MKFKTLISLFLLVSFTSCSNGDFYHKTPINQQPQVYYPPLQNQQKTLINNTNNSGNQKVTTENNVNQKNNIETKPTSTPIINNSPIPTPEPIIVENKEEEELHEKNVVLNNIQVTESSFLDSLSQLYGDLGNYPELSEVYQEINKLSELHPNLVTKFQYGMSVQERPLLGWYISNGNVDSNKKKVLITGQTHAVEFIAGLLARKIGYRLAEGYGKETWINNLLNKADFWILPLVNPDGYKIVEQNNGMVKMKTSRVNANGVDLNRNFPYLKDSIGNQRNAPSKDKNSPYYMGEKPLSEPESIAVAELAKKEMFHIAVNCHSFGGLTFAPTPLGDNSEFTQSVLEVFKNDLPVFQPKTKYGFEQGVDASLPGEIDGFLLHNFGTVSVTFEISKLSPRLLNPLKTFKLFWWANPSDIDYWIDNDQDSILQAINIGLDKLKNKKIEPTKNIELVGKI